MGGKWTSADVPDQRGRVAVITGANSGIGFEAAAALADKVARLALMVRDVCRGEHAAERIRATIDFDDLHRDRNYHRAAAYGTPLDRRNLMLAHELLGIGSESRCA